jgi:hypothetical protein
MIACSPSPRFNSKCQNSPAADHHPPEEAETFDQARADFETTWTVFLANRTEADFQAWQDQEAWTAEKYRRFDRGERMPPDWRPSP